MLGMAGLAWPGLVWLGLTNQSRAGLNWTNRKFVFIILFYLFLAQLGFSLAWLAWPGLAWFGWA